MILLILFGTGIAKGDRRVALVVGNGAYQHVPGLSNAVPDAEAMGAKLQQLGFDVQVALDQDRGGMDQALRLFSRKLSGADVALVYYSGHGLQVGERNYLVPVSAKLEYESDLEFDMIAVDQLIELVQSRAKVGMVFLDACRDNPLARRLKGRSRSVERGLALVRVAQGDMLLVFATSPGYTAADGTGRHSPFTDAVLEHIATPGLEVQVMLKRVIQSVRENTHGRQVPWQHATLTTEVYLAGRAEGRARAYKLVREPRPTWRYGASIAGFAAGAALIGFGASALSVNGSCADAAVPCAAYRTTGIGAGLLVPGIVLAGASIVLLALPGGTRLVEADASSSGSLAQRAAFF